MINETKWNEAKELALKSDKVRDYSYIKKVYNKLVKKSEYTFRTEQFAFEMKGGKHYVTGYISNTERDIVDDIVTEKALKSMLKQINESTITLDYEHEAFRDDPTILPAGKIVEAKIDDRGLWVKAEINKNSPKFKSLWGSIKDGFLKAFSIAFKPIKVVEKTLVDGTVRLIEELQLLNVAITATPVNQSAVISNYSMKSVMLKAINEVNEMVDENVEKPAEVKEEAKVEEVAEAPKEEVKEEAKVEEKGEFPPKKKDGEEDEEEEDKDKKKKVEEKSVIAELKSLRKEIESQNKEIKDLKEKGIFKSKISEQPIVEKSVDVKDMLSMI